ncbi:MAG: hypothetical protein ACOC7N_06060, partial [Chloroflexota bacterium]
MAKILLAEEWAEPAPLATQLEYDLSEEYLIVSDPTVQGRKLDAVVVGPQGLFVLHRTAARGETPVQEDGEGRVGQARRALKGFLQDEFPALSPGVYHLLVSNRSQEEDEASSSADVFVATLESAAQEIASVDPPASEAVLDDEERQELAVALRERRLTVSQRASQPFVFRSGDAFGSGTEVWTIREAVRHMAAHPESGIYHLRNGTLAAWLHSEGAEHLARDARDVLRSHTDRRAALETFLIRTGLVDPPSLRVRPQEVDLGYLTAGDEVTRRIRIGKGPGRGYLFGTLEPSVPWLSVYPRHFNSSDASETVVAVRAKTESLPIGQRPSRASILVHSNASSEPLEVPVHLRVVGMPSAFNRRLLRPVAGFTVAGLAGAVLGGLLTVGGVPAGDSLAGLRWLPLSPAAVWVLVVALVWGALGALRGAMQPEAWPTSYAMRRWLLRILVWAVSLALVGAACLWGWRQLLPSGALPGTAFRSLLVIPMALAVVPATVGEIRSGPEMRDTSLRAIRWSFWRPLLLPLAAIVLALAVAVGAPQLRPALQRLNVPEVASSVGEWTEARLVQVGERLDEVIDELYMRYYERRAPG